MPTTRAVLSAALLGWAAGIRSLTPLAVLSRAAVGGRLSLRRFPFDLLSIYEVSALLILAALGEMIVDKLPITPARTAHGAWLGRVATGSLAGAAVAAEERIDPRLGALVSGCSALISTFVSYGQRMALNRILPNPVSGALGDIFAVGVSILGVITAEEE